VNIVGGCLPWSGDVFGMKSIDARGTPPSKHVLPVNISTPGRFLKSGMRIRPPAALVEKFPISIIVRVGRFDQPPGVSSSLIQQLVILHLLKKGIIMTEDIFTKEEIKAHFKLIEGRYAKESEISWIMLAVAFIKSIVYLADKIGGKSGD
jgi:hypothetical protein